jgi:hypothetical protein
LVNEFTYKYSLLICIIHIIWDIVENNIYSSAKIMKEKKSIWIVDKENWEMDGENPNGFA